MKNITKYTFLGCFGALLYMLIEFGWRSYTHWSSALMGAACFIFIGCINEIKSDISVVEQMIIGGIFTTLIELIMGIIVNIFMGENAWNYSNMWGNVLGQICPLFSLIWILLSFVGIIVDDLLRWIFFKEPFPKYKWR